MQIRGFSSRRSLVTLCGVLCAVLMLALSAAAGAASGLPNGARFHKALGEGHSLTVQVGSKGLSVTLSGVPIRCTKDTSKQGGEARVGLGLSAPERPQVGRSYNLSKTKTESEEKGGSTTSSTTELTLNFKSAKQVLVSIHQVSSTDGKVDCDGSGTFSVKRQS
jgi:hypothetical protein